MLELAIPRLRWRAAALLGALALALAACGGGEPQPTSFAGITLIGDRAYLASNLFVHKLDARSGSELWRFPAQQDGNNPVGPFAGRPVKLRDAIIVGGTLQFAGAPDNRLYAIRDADGVELWRFVPSPTAKEFADGVATDGKLIFAPNGDHTLYAIDPSQVENGAPRVVWTFKTGNRLWSVPEVAEGKVFLPSLDHSLYALDAASGQLLWKFTAGASIASTPTFYEGVLYVGSFDQTFYAINASDGSVRWKAAVDAWIWCQALVDGERVIVGDVKGKLYAFDRATGQRLWTAQTGGPIRAQPVAVGDSLYVVSFDSYLYRLPRNPTPREDGSVPLERVLENGLGRRLLSTPVVYEDLLLVPLFDGDIKLVAVNLTNAQKQYEVRVVP
ncbi:MAG: PQQ-binding-like beta-propeller repeat protein [Anaerolineae bacterium]|nr:PQQ-binding-like beta-propeller repeat protein [Anaerolineae bacterium]